MDFLSKLEIKFGALGFKIGLRIYLGPGAGAPMIEDIAPKHIPPSPLQPIHKHVKSVNLVVLS